MKILQINCSAGGSTGNIASSIHQKLLAEGYDSYFAYGLGKCDLKKTYRISNWLDNHIHLYLANFTGFHGFFSVICTLRFLSFVNKIKPDIIHLHNLHGYYLNIPLVFKYIKKNNISIMWTLHDCWAYTGKCPHYTMANCEKWKNECYGCSQKKQYPFSYLFDTSGVLYKYKKKLFTSIDDINIVTVSNWLKSQAKMSFLSSFDIKTIYNGIDTQTFTLCDNNEYINKKYKLASDDKLILGVASGWSERKGLKNFIDISYQLKENEKIILVGLTDSQIEMLPQNITGIKRTENKQELAMLYSRADVFLNTSKEETFGLVTAEALSCGAPVVAFDSTACSEIITEKCGIVLKNDDIHSIINGIRSAYKFKINSRDFNLYINNNFSKEKMVNNYLGEYKKYIKK